ncbi:hypothetical protein [Asaia sp. HN010]|uniref:hypothetical protein n=1 Tax=Asaia sp. HN010 TaxID=3081233 RepID=UPI00301AF3CC
MDTIAIPVFFAKNAAYDAVAARSEMASQNAFFLAAKPLNDIYNILMLSNARKPLDAYLLEKIPAHFTKKSAGPSMPRNGGMNVGSFVVVE